jgi:hypothetical protein
MWRACFGRGFGPVVRQTTKWINLLENYLYSLIIHSKLIWNSADSITQFNTWNEIIRIMAGINSGISCRKLCM